LVFFKKLTAFGSGDLSSFAEFKLSNLAGVLVTTMFFQFCLEKFVYKKDAPKVDF